MTVLVVTMYSYKILVGDGGGEAGGGGGLIVLTMQEHGRLIAHMQYLQPF